jgi:hypothetical protein
MKAAASLLLSLLLPVFCRGDALDQWMTRTSPVPVSLQDITYAQGLFVAVGTDTNNGGPRVIVSNNGLDWNRFVSFARFTPTAITYGNGLFVAVGLTYLYDVADTAGVIVSTNGTNWSFFPTFGASSLARTNFFGVAYGNGLFVATGDRGTIATSTDGTNWATHATPTPYQLTSAAYGNGLWVAAGPKEPDGGPTFPSQGPLLMSTDGTNWVQQNAAFNAIRVIYARDMFFAIAGDTFQPNLLPIRYSFNGTNWFDIFESSIHVMRNIAYGGDIFAAVGNGIIKTSFNLWAQRMPVPAVTNRLRAIAYGANTFVAVGDIIVQSGDIRPHLRIRQGNGLGDYEITLTGLVGSIYSIETSTNLLQWQTNFSVHQFSNEMPLRVVPRLPIRYYRARQVDE